MVVCGCPRTSARFTRRNDADRAPLLDIVSGLSLCSDLPRKMPSMFGNFLRSPKRVVPRTDSAPGSFEVTLAPRADRPSQRGWEVGCSCGLASSGGRFIRASNSGGRGRRWGGEDAAGGGLARLGVRRALLDVAEPGALVLGGPAQDGELRLRRLKSCRWRSSTPEPQKAEPGRIFA